MGNLVLKMFFLHIFFPIWILGQKSKVIRLYETTDHTALIKKVGSSYQLKIFYSKNINFNKQTKPIVETFAGNLKYCEKCKKEFDVFILEKTKKPHIYINTTN
jgi:hypothetical protein